MISSNTTTPNFFTPVLDDGYVSFADWLLDFSHEQLNLIPTSTLGSIENRYGYITPNSYASSCAPQGFSCLATMMKVLCFCTIILPLIALMIKSVSRLNFKYNKIDTNTNLILSRTLAYPKPTSVIEYNGIQHLVFANNGYFSETDDKEIAQCTALETIQGIDIGPEGSLMHFAVLGGHVNLLNFLIKKGEIDINQKDFREMTPLMLALYSNEPAEILPMVQALIKAKANVNEPRENGCRPVHIAIEQNLPQVLKALIDAGADLTIDHPYKNKPLLEITDNQEIIKILKERSAQ